MIAPNPSNHQPQDQPSQPKGRNKQTLVEFLRESPITRRNDARGPDADEQAMIEYCKTHKSEQVETPEKRRASIFRAKTRQFMETGVYPKD